MAYLVIGTVAQKYIGLYEATRIFFSSPVIWFGILPLPGLPVLIALIFINLTCKLIFKSPWRWDKAGTIMAHIGVMLLLLGGLFTALFSTEGYVDLAATESKNFVTDYHARELVLLDDKETILQSIPFKNITKGETLDFAPIPLSINILDTCRHCKITKREDAGSFSGMAQHMQLTADKLRNDDEENISGITFRAHDTGYLVIEGVNEFPEIEVDGKIYHFALRRAQRALPFTIELLEFRRDMYPGTALAKSYQSRVRIIDGNSRWESLISMNEPLRYKGYTFFQSSYIATPEGDVSVLAAVWNAGRAFPYIAGIAVCIGLIVHLFMRRKKAGGRA